MKPVFVEMTFRQCWETYMEGDSILQLIIRKNFMPVAEKAVELTVSSAPYILAATALFTVIMLGVIIIKKIGR